MGTYTAIDENTFEEKRETLQVKFKLLEPELVSATFFSGEKFCLIDAVYGPIFRYFDVFDQFTDLNIFDKLKKTQSWRSNLKKRQSVRNAVTSEYSELLITFIQEKNRFLSSLIT